MINTAGKLALSFYNNPQTEDYNTGDGFLSDAVINKDQSFLGKFGAQVSIGMSTSFDVPDQHIPNVLRE